MVLRESTDLRHIKAVMGSREVGQEEVLVSFTGSFAPSSRAACYVPSHTASEKHTSTDCVSYSYFILVSSSLFSCSVVSDSL